MPVEPHIVDTQSYMAMLQELVAQGETVSLTVTGNSMAPFLRHGRDQIQFARPDRPLRRGDMAFFRRRNGQYVMHRVLRTAPDGACWLVGDGQQEVEGPIRPEQIFAVVTRVCRKGQWMGVDGFWWRFFAGPWLTLLPLRPLLRRLARWVPKGWK